MFIAKNWRIFYFIHFRTPKSMLKYNRQPCHRKRFSRKKKHSSNKYDFVFRVPRYLIAKLHIEFSLNFDFNFVSSEYLQCYVYVCRIEIRRRKKKKNLFNELTIQLYLLCHFASNKIKKFLFTLHITKNSAIDLTIWTLKLNVFVCIISG